MRLDHLLSREIPSLEEITLTFLTSIPVFPVDVFVARKCAVFGLEGSPSRTLRAA